jgi:hypothetical protein
MPHSEVGPTPSEEQHREHMERVDVPRLRT